MLTVKHDLLQALAASLEKLSPGSCAKAAFESPKVAAHGDFARATQFQTLALEKMAADEDLSKDRRAAARKRMSARLGKYRNDRDYVLDYRAIDEMRAGRL